MKIFAATTLILWVFTMVAALYADKYRPFDDRLEDWVRWSALVALTLTAALCGWVLA